MSSCYFEDITSPFQYGKHKGESLSDVISTDPSYIYWCINNIPSFCLSDTALRQIREIFPMFVVTEDFSNHLERYIVYDDEENEDYIDDYSCCSQRLNEDDAEPTYERYNGTYAQDEMGYSDDDIDTIFEGDPSAYWNID